MDAIATEILELFIYFPFIVDANTLLQEAGQPRGRSVLDEREKVIKVFAVVSC